MANTLKDLSVYNLLNRPRDKPPPLVPVPLPRETREHIRVTLDFAAVRRLTHLFAPAAHASGLLALLSPDNVREHFAAIGLTNYPLAAPRPGWNRLTQARQDALDDWFRAAGRFDEEAIDAINSWTRAKMKEDGIWHKFLRPTPVGVEPTPASVLVFPWAFLPQPRRVLMSERSCATS